MPWLIAGRAKPGATVLAGGLGDDAAVIAAQAYGLGRSCGSVPTAPGVIGFGPETGFITDSGGRWWAGPPV